MLKAPMLPDTTANSIRCQTFAASVIRTMATAVAIIRYQDDGNSRRREGPGQVDEPEKDPPVDPVGHRPREYAEEEHRSHSGGGGDAYHECRVRHFEDQPAQGNVLHARSERLKECGSKQEPKIPGLK